MIPFKHFTALAAVSVLFLSPASGQINSFPYFENFDAISPPALPEGWSSSQNRTAGTNDFTSTSSSSYSAPNALLSTNATIEQILGSPIFNLLEEIPDSILFFSRRSSTHLAPVVLEASLDSGVTFPLHIGDTLFNLGTTSYVRSAFPLSDTLSTSVSVAFRWRVIPGSSGTTGTFRIDDLSVTTRTLDDLSLTILDFSPQFPVANDTIWAEVMISNAGLRTAPGFAVEIFLDMNGDSTGQGTELIATLTSATSIEPGDSSEVVIDMGSFAQGSSTIIATVNYDPDRNLSNNTSLKTLVVGYPPFSIVINEIMYAPIGSEPEWIELFNTTGDSIDLTSWEIADENAGSSVSFTDTSFLIAQTDYVIITDDSAALFDVHPEIPVHVFHVPTMPAFNNSGDAVVLYDERGAAMDSLTYDPDWGGNSDGTSLERIDPLISSILQSNWKGSLHPDGSTPGHKNSVTQKDDDLCLSNIFFEPLAPVAGDSLSVIARVVNSGRNAAATFSVEFYLDLDSDSIPGLFELLHSVSVSGPLLSGDSIDISIMTNAPEKASSLLIGKISYDIDEDTTNNVLFRTLLVGFNPGSVRINEIMYAPLSGVPEWIELINTSEDTIDITNWEIGNRLATNRYSFADTSPSQLIVITKDTALLRQAYEWLTARDILQVSDLPTFLWNNDGDAVVLLDNRGIRMDSLSYAATWGGTEGTSLERIDPLGPAQDSSNWSSSVDSLGATPARPNSVVALDHDLKLVNLGSTHAAPNSPVMISLVIKNVGKQRSGTCSVTLYNDVNRDSVATPDEEVSFLAISQSLSFGETLAVVLTWQEPPSGTHLVIAELEYDADLRTSNNTTFGTVSVGFVLSTLVINEIMYEPFPDNAEYVEIYNPGGSDVEITGWKLTDLPGEDGTANEFALALTPKTLQAGEFFIIASDSSLFSLFPELKVTESRLITITDGSLSLNNDGDRLVLEDPTERAIDSLEYAPSWHHPGVTDHVGRSLEKINPTLRSSDPRSWNTCTRPTGGTPGEQNSIYSGSLPTGSKLSFTPNPFSPDNDGHQDFTIIHYEIPIDVSTISIRVYDIRGRLIRQLATHEAAGARGDIVWDGRDDENQKARIGMYIVYLEALDIKGGVLETAKGVVVLAARL